MVIALDARCSARIVQQLQKILADIKVDHRWFLEFYGANELTSLDKILPTSGAVKASIDAIFSDDERISEFSADWVARKLRSTQTYSTEKLGESLSSLDDFQDLDGVATAIVKAFEHLPTQYVISLKLTKAVGSHFPGIDNAGDQAQTSSPRILKVDENFRTAYPENPAEPGSALLSLFSNHQHFEDDDTCLQFDIAGFIDIYGSTHTAAAATEDIRAVFGLCVAMLLFDVSAPRIPSAFGPAKQKVRVHRRTDEGLEFDTDFELEADTSALIERIEIMHFNGITAENQSKYAAHCFRRIQAVFREGERGRRVRRAARWLFDSYEGANQLLSFVQAMISLEILLGDKEASSLTGLTELLSNRCAYLLGSTEAERQEILKDVKKIYEVRSQIVHNGKSRLTNSERLLFYKLRNICRRAIDKELELLVTKPQDLILKALTTK